MIQWCIGHLSDAELVTFLQRSQKALRRSEFGLEGYIVLKENICRDDTAEGAGALFDDDDSSITRWAPNLLAWLQRTVSEVICTLCRSDKVFRKVFEDAGLTVIRKETQKGFPVGALPPPVYDEGAMI